MVKNYEIYNLTQQSNFATLQTFNLDEVVYLLENLEPCTHVANFFSKIKCLETKSI